MANKTTSMLFMIATMLSSLFLVFNQDVNIRSKTIETTLIQSSGLVPHAPFVFTTNQQIANVAIAGNGTSANPYIIENYFIQCDGSSNGVDFIDTDAYTLVRNCWVNNTSGFHAAFGGSRTKNLIFENCTTTRLNCLGGFGFVNSTDCTVINCSMMDRGFFMSGCNNTLIENCSIVNGLGLIWNEVNGYQVDNYNITIRNVNFTNCPGYIYSEIGMNVTCVINGTHGLVMNNINIVNSSSFIFINSTSVILSDWTQESNIDAFGFSIMFGNCSDVLVDNANIFNVNVTMAVLDSENVTIYNSDLMLEALDQNSTSSFFNATVLVINSTNVTLDKNFIECEDSNNGFGLLTFGCTNMTITNTTFDSTSIPLLMFSSTGAEIHGNMFSNNTNGTFIDESCSNINFTHNEFYECPALYFFNDSTPGNYFGNNAYSDYDLNGSVYTDGDLLPNPHVVTTLDRNITDTTPWYSIFDPLDPPPTPPVAHFRLRLFLNPLNLNSGQLYRFIFNGYRGRPRCTFQWNFGDGTANMTTRNVRHAFTYAGNYTVTLTCQNIAGTRVFRMQVVVHGLINLSPDATFTSNSTTIIIGATVAFTHNGSNGNTPTTYQWNFGDGTANATTENSTHQFTTAGTRTITLTLMDTDGDIDVYTLPGGIIVVPPTVIITIIARRLNITGENIDTASFKLFVNGTLKPSPIFVVASNTDYLIVIKDSYSNTMYSNVHSAGSINQTITIVLQMYLLKVINNRDDDIKFKVTRNSVSITYTVRDGSDYYILLYAGTINYQVKDTADNMILRESTLSMTKDRSLTFSEDQETDDQPWFFAGLTGTASMWIAILIIIAIITAGVIVNKINSKKKKRNSRSRN